jgi:hypothetical protein
MRYILISTALMALCASASADQPKTSVDAPTCDRGDASFEDGCANSSAAADAKMAALAKAARLRKLAQSAATPANKPDASQLVADGSLPPTQH